MEFNIKDATALDVLDALEKQFLMGAEAPEMQRDEKGRFTKALRRGFRWSKGFYKRGVQEEGQGVTYAEACLVGGVLLLDPAAREPIFSDDDRASGVFRMQGGEYKPETPGEEAMLLLLTEAREKTGEALRAIPDFNDDHRTTFEDVLALIRAAKERFWRQ